MGVALIALFTSLGGVSYGVATGSIDSREIKNNTVRSKDIRNNQVSTRDLRNGSARGRDVRNNTLTGSDVLESSLGEVPNAENANNANSANTANSAGSVDGHDFAAVDFRVPANTGTTTFLNFGGLQLIGACNAGGDLNVTAATTVNNSQIHVGTLDSGTTEHNYAEDDDFDVGQSVNVVPTVDDNVRGGLTFGTPAGTVVSIEYLAEEQTNGQGGANDCFFYGTATQD